MKLSSMVKRSGGARPLLVFCGVALVASACGGAAGKSTPSASSKALKPGPGFDGKTISVGDVGLLSGPTAKVGIELNDGVVAYFKALNAKGGIDGKYPVNLVQGDDQLTDSVAVQQYNQLKDQVAMFAAFFGTPTSDAILPLAKQDQMLVGASGLEAAWVQQPNFLPVGPTYQLMAANAIDYYIKKAGGQGKTICTLTRNDAYGQDGLQGTQFAAQNLGFTIKSSPTFVLNAADFTGQIATLQSASCDAVFVAAAPPELARIMGAAAQARFAPQWIAQAAGYDPSLLATPVGSYLEQRVWVDGPAYSPGNTAAPGMDQMTAALHQYAPTEKPSFWFMFGYSQGQAATVVLEQAVKDHDLSPAGILKASQEIGSVTTMLGTYTYGPPTQRKPALATSVFKLDPTAVYGEVPLAENFQAPFDGNYSYPAGQ